MAEKDALDLLMLRRSIRKYTPQTVSKSDIELILKAAMSGPSAVDARPWEFVVVSDAEQLARLRDALPFGKINAPLAIVVCSNLSIATHPAAQLYWEQDCSIAAQNILIEAASLGLGSVWTAIYPNDATVKNVREVSGLPESVTPLCALFIGHAAESVAPRTQYEEKRVHWQSY